MPDCNLFVTVCCVSKLSEDSFLSCSNTILLFCALCLKECAHSAVLKGIITIAWLEGLNEWQMLCFLETRCILRAAHFVLSENNSCKAVMVPKTNTGLIKVCSDYLRQELELEDRFGRRSGRGWSAGFHPWHFPGRGRLLSPLNETHKNISIRIDAAQEVQRPYLQRGDVVQTRKCLNHAKFSRSRNSVQILFW